jgi:S-adenosylmethionine:tRNA ribosyltransferase-isomerase
MTEHDLPQGAQSQEAHGAQLPSLEDAEYYAYDLPTERIAQSPIPVRSEAKLLDGRGTTMVDRRVSEMPSLLEPGDIVVVNNTRVMSCRYHVRRESGGAAEVFVVNDRGDDTWEAMVRPSARLRRGEVLYFEGKPLFRLVDDRPRGVDHLVMRRVSVLDAALFASVGETPLPPYIKESLRDPERYQTVFSASAGSVAAPTAGLHFDESTLTRFQLHGIPIYTVDLRVGLGTFIGLTKPTLAEHHMHTERYDVPEETWDAVQSARRVVAIGTTVVRALESVSVRGERSGATDLFIRPGFRFQAVDLLMTNFHAPHSTLLVLLEAFYGSRWKALYEYALARDYRFLSFGDATLLDLASPRSTR